MQNHEEMVQIMMRLHNFFRIGCYRIVENYILGKDIGSNMMDTEAI